MKISKIIRATSFVLVFAISLASVAFATEGNSRQYYEYSVNARGETFGTSLQASILGYEPVLLLAHGIDGTIGYVRSADLNDGCNSPIEANKMMEQKCENNESGIEKTILLYLADGETIVGEFNIVSGSNNTEPSRSDYTYGGVKNMPMPGYVGTGASGIKLNLTYVNGITTVSTTMSVNIGWIGIQSRIICEEDNAVVACSNYAYNQSTVMSFSKDISHITISSDHYYSQGRVKLWNHEESEYEPFSMKRSPNV